MRRPSSRMRQTLVTLLQHAWSKDVDGGRVIASTATTTDVNCSVESGTPTTGVDETGRWTTENHFTLRFSFDPGLDAHDEVTWTEPTSSVTGTPLRVHNLVVLGTANKMGRGATWEVSCTERI